MLLKKDLNKRQKIKKIKPIILLNADYNIWVKILAKRPAFVVDKLIGNAKTCDILKGIIPDNLHSLKSR